MPLPAGASLQRESSLGLVEWGPFVRGAQVAGLLVALGWLERCLCACGSTAVHLHIWQALGRVVAEVPPSRTRSGCWTGRACSTLVRFCLSP